MARINQLQSGIWTNEVWLEGYNVDVRGVIIEGSEKVLFWDTLTHPRDLEPFRDLLKPKPTWAIYSHADWDHIWGTSGYPIREVVGHKDSKARFQQEVYDTLASMQGEQPGIWEEVKIIPPTITFDEYMRLDLGGISIELFSIPGHTGDSIVGFIPERGIFLGGDVVEDPFPILGQGYSLTGWIERLQYWSENPDVQVVIPAHGAIGTRELIARNVKYLRGLSDGSSLLPEGLSEFYNASHVSNLELARKARNKKEYL